MTISEEPGGRPSLDAHHSESLFNGQARVPPTQRVAVLISHIAQSRKQVGEFIAMQQDGISKDSRDEDRLSKMLWQGAWYCQERKGGRLETWDAELVCAFLNEQYRWLMEIPSSKT